MEEDKSLWSQKRTPLVCFRAVEYEHELRSELGNKVDFQTFLWHLQALPFLPPRFIYHSLLQPLFLWPPSPILGKQQLSFYLVGKQFSANLWFLLPGPRWHHETMTNSSHFTAGQFSQGHPNSWSGKPLQDQVSKVVRKVAFYRGLEKALHSSNTVEFPSPLLHAA